MPRQIVAVNLLFYVRACPHSGDYSGTSLGVRSVALLHSRATLAPLLLFDIHAPLYIGKKEMKSITSLATFFTFLHFVVQWAVSVIDEERRCRLPDGATTKKEVAIS